MPGPAHSHDYDDEEQELEDSGGGLRRYLKPVALAVAVLLCAATVIFYGYRWMFGGPADTDLPLVQAIDDPVKVKPESPGGLVVPYKEQLVLNQGATDAGGEPVVERLLPPPEAPQWPPQAPESLGATTAPEGTVGSPEPAPATAAPTETAGQSGEAETAAGSGEIAVQEAPTPPAAPAKVEPPAKPAAEETKTAALTAKPAPSGTYTLQLASITSSNAAGPAWKGMQKAHPDVLGPLDLTVQKADVGGKTYYRIQAGTFNERAEAARLCARLKAAQQDCLVVRR